MQMNLEAHRLHRLSGLTVREEPLRAPGAGVGQVLTGLDVGPHQVGDGLRQRGRRVSQPDGDGGLVVDDLVDGEADETPD
ncbi:hypothetical protein PV371_36410 [Streptomyces sp. TX20-6-3]|uniref:hypothetical protein n=1 Tax=Streptomyces sp. TX20-6-3 TaxID=3028705 RepID=UPI0029BA935E|nr:hypothetical protein [Streptomyces sp. TX20-6-3]MDX2565112.1 hypothetical protein [Streptomyces sp. TX20-6-3]